LIRWNAECGCNALMDMRFKWLKAKFGCCQRANRNIDVECERREC
jgi:hypothetical protein